MKNTERSCTLHLTILLSTYLINASPFEPVVSRAEANIVFVDDDHLMAEDSSLTNQTRFKRSMSIRASNVRYPVNYLRQSRPPNEKWRNYLIAKHNEYRSQVPATNMRYVYWNDYLARTAQAHADRCDFRHSNNRQNIGENIWAAGFSDYSDAVRLWFVEVYDKRCQCPHYYKHCCGHYVQVAWAETYQMGCGAARCRDIWGIQGRGHRNVLVCHYNPAGNTIILHPGGTYYVPAFRRTNSTHGRCSDCPRGLNKCWNNKLCY